VTKDEFALRIESIRKRLYKTALVYLGNETFDTWVTRILINECYNELRRHKRVQYVDVIPETAVEKYENNALQM